MLGHASAPAQRREAASASASRRRCSWSISRPRAPGPTSRTTHPVRPALRRAARRHLQRVGACRTTRRSTSTIRPRPIRRWRRRASRPSTRSRRCRTSASAPLDWDEEGPRYAKRILEIIEERMMPGLRRAARTPFHFGPADFESELNSHLGSAFSLEPILTQSAYFRVHNRDDMSSEPLFRRRGHASRRRHPRRGRQRQGDRGADDRGPRGMTRDEIVAGAREAIQHGSKSFRAASRLFDRDDARAGVAALLLVPPLRRCLRRPDLRLRPWRARAMSPRCATRPGARSPASRSPRIAVPRACASCSRNARSRRASSTIICSGFRARRGGWQPRNEEELVLYCYYVAGAVGCMMAIVMGVPAEDEETLERAADLGIAFQLSNIARDIREDLRSGPLLSARRLAGGIQARSRATVRPENRRGADGDRRPAGRRRRGL